MEPEQRNRESDSLSNYPLSGELLLAVTLSGCVRLTGRKVQMG